MTARILLEPAFILHRRAYQNTSWILDILSSNHGRVSVLAQGARSMQSRYKGRLELFVPLRISWTGRRTLKHLSQVEFDHLTDLLQGNALLCAFYLNELLMRLLQINDPCPTLFYAYHQALIGLLTNDTQIVLRQFEKKLLQEIGYALPLQQEASTQLPLQAEYFYRYIPDVGFVSTEEKTGSTIFSGASLLAVHGDDFANPLYQQDTKRLMRLALGHILGNRAIKSRELLY